MSQPLERLFFALWPNQPFRQELTILSKVALQVASGKSVPKDNWHITLAFIGEVNQTVKTCLLQAASTISIPPFDLTMDTLMYWQRNQILWFGAHQTPLALQTLVTELNNKLSPCNYHPDTRPFQAHITLMRKAVITQPLPSVTTLNWRIEEFALVKSIIAPSGVKYQVIKHWPLLGNLSPTEN